MVRASCVTHFNKKVAGSSPVLCINFKMRYTMTDSMISFGNTDITLGKEKITVNPTITTDELELRIINLEKNAIIADMETLIIEKNVIIGEMEILTERLKLLD